MAEDTQLFAVLDGRGTFRGGGMHLKPGATPITPEEADYLRRSGPAWVRVQEGREAGKVLPPIEPEPEPEPFAKFLGRDGKWYYHEPVAGGANVQQSGAYDTEDEVDAAILEAQVETPLIPLADEVTPGPESGMLIGGDVALDKPVTCRAVGCVESFSDSGARVNHERVMHPELFQV